MSCPSKSHPDRAAATLANVDEQRAARGDGPFAAPGAGAFDCRIDLKLLQWRALAAAARSPRAQARLAAFAAEAHPDLWAGTVQDGTARGFAAALEEAVALAPAPAGLPAPPSDEPRLQTSTGKALRKRKDLLVASGGARVRFSRKQGLLFVARDDGTHAANCLWFEARRDHGTLDGFVAAPDERARLFSAQFLAPQSYVEGPAYTRLELAGRLGRGPIGWPCEVTRVGLAGEPHVHLRVAIDHQQPGWRLRLRLLGVPSAGIAHDCTPVREVVANDHGGFVACTLVRACTHLAIDDTTVATPAAACLGRITHDFRLSATMSV